MKVLRQKSGYNGVQFAEVVGISPQYLYDIEGGRRTLKRNPALLGRIAAELGVPIPMIEHRPPPPALEVPA